MGLLYTYNFTVAKLTDEFGYQPAFKDFSNYRMHNIFGYEIPLGATKWKLKLGTDTEYQSKPPPGADKLDTTEECVRFRSHNKFFVDALANSEASGRKLNFLLQEMNREANTIGSKSNSVDIAHLVVRVKEELEKIREQLQNIE